MVRGWVKGWVKKWLKGMRVVEGYLRVSWDSEI